MVLIDVNLVMIMGVEMDNLLTVVDKLPNVMHMVFARLAVPDTVLVAVVLVAARGHGQVRLLAGPANPPELWIWENVEA